MALRHRPAEAFATGHEMVTIDAHADDFDIEGTQSEEEVQLGDRGHPPAALELFHKVKNSRSILSLIVSDGRIFAGTQGGEIIVWSFQTYEEIRRLEAHRGAVLGLCVSPDGERLFSCAGDAIVNIWSARTYTWLYSMYSTFDVGDVFCVAYSPILDTLILGAQNTSIQWYDLSRKDIVPQPNLKSHPSQRNHRFFDSKGPGGISTPRSDYEYPDSDESQLLEIGRLNIIQYAHYGYVYCMTMLQNSSITESDAEILITGGGDGSVKLWHVSRKDQKVTVVPRATLDNGDSSVLTLALQDTLLYAGKLEGEIDVWDLDTRQVIQTIKAADADILSLAVGFGYVFAGIANGYAKIFERHRRITEWKAHDQLILAMSLAENNDKSYLVTGGNDGCIATWDLTNFLGAQTSLPRASNELLVQSIGRFISFRSVSARDEYREDCRRAASWLRNLFKSFGAQTELLKTDEGCNPIVYACFKGKSSIEKRTLFYGHYDVVPAEQDKWNSDPFSLYGRDGYLYGRGVSDNKGPVLAAAYAVADLVTAKQLESDVVFLIEGEEEKGSRGFARAFQNHKALIGNICWILLANSYWLDNDFPCLTYGLRGVVNATLIIESGNVDAHSGVSGSNAVHEPLKDLIALLSSVSSSYDNHINIPGFYENIRPFTKQEEHWYNAISDMSARSQSKVHDPELLKSRWREPSFTVHGFTTSSSGVATVIPHQATAQVSFRLVPDQEGDEISVAFEEFLQAEFEKLDSPNELKVKMDHSVDPWLGDPNNGLYKVLDDAIVEVWELDGLSKIKDQKHQRKRSSTAPRRPLYIREGGSIPAIRFLEKELDAPAAQLPCGQASDNAHLENERIRLTNLYNARDIFKKVFRKLPTR